MTDKKLTQQQKTLVFALVLVGAYCNAPLTIGSIKAQAQSAIPEVSTATRTQLLTSRLSMTGQVMAQLPLNNTPIVVQQSKYGVGVQVAQTKPTPPPPDQGAPGSREGAASRGRCPASDKPLTALVPLTQETLRAGQNSTPVMSSPKTVLGLTVTEHPTFWFYVPYPLTSTRSAEFVLQDDKGKDIYQSSLIESGTTPGVVGFKLPSTVPPLEVSKRYHWYFLIHCNSEETVVVDGWVERVALKPLLKSQLAQATPQERVTLYAQAGLWHEALTALAKLRSKNPDDAKLIAEWDKLLESIDLKAIAQEPITSVLTPNE
jgi:hypothetical protein